MSTVSVVIPTFNYARFLGRALDSALGQTHAPSEIIVVDDGSTDDTPAVLERYSGLVKVHRQSTCGASAARNAGIALSTGDLIALLDSDDRWLPTKLERQVALFRQHPECGAIGCGVEVVDADDTVIRTVLFTDAIGCPEDRVRRIALRRSWVGGSGSGALIPRAVLADLGCFDERLRGAEDWDLWLRIAIAYDIRNVPEHLARIVDHRTGTFRNAERVAAAQFEVLAKLVDATPNAVSGTYLRRVRALIDADAAGELYGSAQWSASTRRAARALIAWPFEPSIWRLMLGAASRALRQTVGP